MARYTTAFNSPASDLQEMVEDAERAFDNQRQMRHLQDLAGSSANEVLLGNSPLYPWDLPQPDWHKTLLQDPAESLVLLDAGNPPVIEDFVRTSALLDSHLQGAVRTYETTLKQTIDGYAASVFVRANRAGFAYPGTSDRAVLGLPGSNLDYQSR